MSKLNKYASHFFKHECMRARLEVFQSESETRGVDFIIKTKSSKYIEIDLKTINLESGEREIKFPKSDWDYELPENRYVAFVAFMKEIDPAIYLIPCQDFGKNKNDRILDENDSGDERSKHMANWEIKLFTNGTKEINERYGWSTVVPSFK